MADFFVKDFGAAGDGTTDDSAHIQAAITAAAQGRGRLRIEGGIFAIKTKLDVPGGSTLEWHDGALLKALPGFSGGAMLHLQKVHHVSLINPQLDGNRQAIADRRIIGIESRSSDLVRIVGGHLRNFPGTPATDGSFTPGDGIYVGSAGNGADPSDNWWIKDTLIENCARNGLSVTSGRFSVFEGLVIRGAGHAAIDIEPDHPLQRAVGLAVRNCICTRNNQFGIVLAADPVTLTGHTALIGNTIEEGGVGTSGLGNGIHIQSYAPCQIIGNVIRNNKGYAIGLINTSTVSLVGNSLSAQHSNLIVNQNTVLQHNVGNMFVYVFDFCNWPGSRAAAGAGL